MKARGFRYFRPESLPEATGALLSAGPDAVPMAGGQSLLAALNMRLSAPSLIVDIGDLPELQGIEEKDGALRIGAATRHADILRSPLVRSRLPLLCTVGEHIAHVAIRNRGTIGGSLAYADPAAEWPATMVALQATFTIARASGERTIRAEDFFKGLLETALEPGDILVRIDVPLPGPDMRMSFDELARRHGNFALAGLVACGRIEGTRLTAPRLVYLGCAEHARPALNVMQALDDAALPLADNKLFAQALMRDLSAADVPGLRGDTRLKMAAALTRRVVNSLMRSA